jgi:hypothetical protein
MSTDGWVARTPRVRVAKRQEVCFLNTGSGALSRVILFVEQPLLFLRNPEAAPPGHPGRHDFQAPMNSETILGGKDFGRMARGMYGRGTAPALGRHGGLPLLTMNRSATVGKSLWDNGFSERPCQVI